MSNSSNSSTWGPGETSAQVFGEVTWLQGALISNIFYGIALTLYVMCFYLLLRNAGQVGRRTQIFFLSFITVITVLGTIGMGTNMEFTQLAFINNRNFPGGPGAYEEAMFWIPEDETGNIAVVLTDVIMDALLVWRCMVIYKSTGRYQWAIMIFPYLMLVGTAALGVVFLVQTSTSSPFSAVDFTLAYFTLTLALNIIVSILIVIRILLYRRRVREVLGASHISHYGTIAAIIIESASLYSAFSLLLLIPFALNYPLAQLFMQCLPQVQTVASLLIICRVAQGKGWTNDTNAATATSPSGAIHLQNVPGMRFRAGNTEKSMTSDAATSITVTREVFGEKNYHPGSTAAIDDFLTDV